MWHDAAAMVSGRSRFRPTVTLARLPLDRETRSGKARVFGCLVEPPRATVKPLSLTRQSDQHHDSRDEDRWDNPTHGPSLSQGRELRARIRHLDFEATPVRDTSGLQSERRTSAHAAVRVAHADERANVALEDFTRFSLSDRRMWVTRQSGDVRSASEPHHLGLVVSFFVAWGSSMAVVVAVLVTGGDETVPNWLAAVTGAAVVAASWRLYCAMRDDDR